MDNADLEKLKVSQGKLLPKFKPSVTSYSLTVASSVQEVKLSPLTADGGASYVVKGADSGKVVRLTEGQTMEVEVVVTAEDGKTNKTYAILTRRLSANDATLAQLDVLSSSLHPPFSPLVTQYECNLPCSVSNLSLRVKTEDDKMSVSMKDGSPVGTVQLNPGRTIVELSVRSVNDENTTTYSITVIKNRLLPTLQLKEGDGYAFECSACCNVAHQPSRVRGGSQLYCRVCLEELTRTNKVDPFTGRKLDQEEGWLQPDLDCETELAKQTASCVTASGSLDGTVQQMGSKLLAERIKAEKIEEPTDPCPECSKKVPAQDMPLHKDMLCAAKHSVTLPKTEVKARPWEKKLVDESCGSDVKALLQKAKEWEIKYIQSLSKYGDTSEAHSLLDSLQSAARCYGTALKCSPRNLEAHIGLGLVMEEFFYAEDFFGLKKEISIESSEGEAEISSKEEEFLAICQLHGVSATAPLALQLKAVEAEYHSLKDAGQSHKADHVQQLHAWKSKKILQASQGSYAVNMESPLFLAKLKFQDSCSINNSDATACYHMGRLCLLLGEKEEALVYLKATLAQKPMLSPARLCLGLALGPGEGKYAKPLLWHGLTQYLTQIQKLHETQADLKHTPLKELHSQVFYRCTNTLIVEGFLQLARMGGQSSLSNSCCLRCAMSCLPEASLPHRASTYQQLLWSSLKARSCLLLLQHRAKRRESTLRHCQQLSALIIHSGLKLSPQLRTMEMEVFQLGVELQPNSSEALCHLGNGQLVEYEATDTQSWLGEAELSFRASISSEGKPISPNTVPEQLAEQKWWKKNTQQKTAASEKTTAVPSSGAKPAAQKAPPKGPTGSKQPLPKSVGGAKQGGPAPGGRGGAVQPGARKSSEPTATRQPARPAGGAGTKAPGGPTRTGQGSRVPTRPGAPSKTGATLGELKSGSKKSAGTPTSPTASKESTKTAKPAKADSTLTQPAPAPQPPAAKQEVNKKSHLPRLGLARTLRATGNQAKLDESHTLYEEVISMAPDLHDAYIELGEMLCKTNPVAAVEAYARFPFSDPPSFNDAYLHGEIVRLLMASEKYDNPRLFTSMVAMGRALGIGVLEKQVSILENKFKTDLLKKVYSGVHGKPVDDPDLQAFFKFKCWR